MDQLLTALGGMLWAGVKIAAFVVGVLFCSITIIAGLQLLGVL